MKIQPLNDLQKEIDRIFVAGSRFAKGDPRLLKQIPVLEKLSEKAPVFKKLKELLVELTNADEENSQIKLLELSILIYSVLNTLSDSSEKTEMQQIDTSSNNIEIKTQLPFSKLNQFKTVFKGKLEDKEVMYIIESCKDGSLNDVRLYKDIANGLNSQNYNVTDVIEDCIAKEMPEQLFKYIYNDFDLKGEKKEARKFRIINSISEEKGKELIEDILNEGSTAMKVEAVKILGKDKNNEELILSIMKEKKREIIEECTYQLCVMGSKEGIKQSLKILKTTKYKYVINALENCKDETIFDELVEDIEAAYIKLINAIVNTEEKETVYYSQMLSDMFCILKNKGNEQKTYDFALKILQNKDFMKYNKKSYHYADCPRSIIKTIYYLDVKYIESIAKDNKLTKAYASILDLYFDKVSTLYDKSKIYDEFSKVFENNILPVQKFNKYEYVLENDKYYTEHNYTGRFNLDYTKIDKRFTKLYLNKILDEKTNYYDLHSMIIFLENVIIGDDKEEAELLYKFFNKCKRSKNNAMRNIEITAQILFKAGYKNIGDELIEDYINKPNIKNYYSYLEEETIVTIVDKKYEQTFRDLYEKTKQSYYLRLAELLSSK